jgi:hypothetical protein
MAQSPIGNSVSGSRVRVVSRDWESALTRDLVTDEEHFGISQDQWARNAVLSREENHASIIRQGAWSVCRGAIVGIIIIGGMMAWKEAMISVTTRLRRIRRHRAPAIVAPEQVDGKDILSSRAGLTAVVSRLIGVTDSYEMVLAARCTWMTQNRGFFLQMQRLNRQALAVWQAAPPATRGPEPLNITNDPTCVVTFESNTLVCEYLGIKALANPTDSDYLNAEIKRQVTKFCESDAIAAQVTRWLYAEYLRALGNQAGVEVEEMARVIAADMRIIVRDALVGDPVMRELETVILSPVMRSMWMFARLYRSRFRTNAQAKEAVYRKLVAAFSPYACQQGLSQAADLVARYACDDTVGF